jgi:hypothetical protein
MSSLSCLPLTYSPQRYVYYVVVCDVRAQTDSINHFLVTSYENTKCNTLRVNFPLLPF